MKHSKTRQQNPSPFIKWAGGKSQLISQYKPYFPEISGRYFEPFLGGGAVFFALKPNDAVLSDYNKELINLYTQVRDNPGQLISLLDEHKHHHMEKGKDYYYSVRSLDFSALSAPEGAARTIYLNKTCYNGLYRLNSKGGFNVPMGNYKNPGIYDPENIKAASEALRHAQLVVRDFREVINYAESGDFVYFDPPYHPLSPTANFTGYTELSFSEKDQRDLAGLFRELDRKGCFLMLSNSNTPLIREIYSDFRIVEVMASRFINSDPEKRKPITELLVLNSGLPEKTGKRKQTKGLKSSNPEKIQKTENISDSIPEKTVKSSGKKKDRTPARRENKLDAPWEKLFDKFVSPSDPICFISADQIKKETGLEPRLMAKFDSRENLPPIFRKNNRFLLPVTNGQYAVITGDGYHNIEKIRGEIEIYESCLPFDLKSLDVGNSEMQYIDYAFNSGLITHFSGTARLYPTIRGRKRSPRFEMKAYGISLPPVESVQVEIDAGYESEKEILIIEAKVGRPLSFNIRQLYYPYRFWKTAVPDKKIRTIFMFFDPDESSYEFHEYRFDDEREYSSLIPVKSAAYRITGSNASTGENLGNMLKDAPAATQPKHNWIIPQANDMNKIIELPFRVAEGLNKSADIAGYFGFAQRQSSYYREAAESLKLVKLDEGNIYTLTPTGRKFTTLPIEKRNQLLCRQMMDLPIIKEILSNLYEKKTLTFTEVARIIGYNTNLTGETPARRASCLKNWFYWLYSATGMIKVSKTRLFL